MPTSRTCPSSLAQRRARAVHHASLMEAQVLLTCVDMRSLVTAADADRANITAA